MRQRNTRLAYHDARMLEIHAIISLSSNPWRLEEAHLNTFDLWPGIAAARQVSPPAPKNARTSPRDQLVTRAMR